MQLSCSAGRKYMQCPKAYFFHYIRKLKPADRRSPLAFGDAIDEGLNALLLKKDGNKAFLETWTKYKDIPIKYSLGDCDTEDQKQMVRKDVFAPQTQVELWETLLDKGIQMLKDYETEVLPLIKRVISVQEKFELFNEEGDNFVGYIDLIAELQDGTIALLDNKTTSVSYKPDSVKTDEQLALYYAALKEKYGLTKAGFIVVSKKLRKKTTPPTKIDVIIDDISQELIDKTYATYDNVMTNIKDGNFERDYSGCRTKYGPCDYYNYCHKNDKTGLKEND